MSLKIIKCCRKKQKGKLVGWWQNIGMLLVVYHGKDGKTASENLEKMQKQALKAAKEMGLLDGLVKWFVDEPKSTALDINNFLQNLQLNSEWAENNQMMRGKKNSMPGQLRRKSKQEL